MRFAFHTRLSAVRVNNTVMTRKTVCSLYFLSIGIYTRTGEYGFFVFTVAKVFFCISSKLIALNYRRSESCILTSVVYRFLNLINTATNVRVCFSVRTHNVYTTRTKQLA